MTFQQAWTDLMQSWDWEDSWVLVAGILCAMSCAILGCFLVLRKMSMMGDAISHAVLPGLVIAFLISQSRGSFVMFIGAVVVGILTAYFTEAVHKYGKVEESASMGVVFTSLFALGLVLIVQFADKIHLDTDCVLYGIMETIAGEKILLLGMTLPVHVLPLMAIFALNCLFVLIFYKELKISSFDPELATTMGINSTVMHYLLMTFVAITTVAAFESVGSILVIAMLIVPAAAAYMLTDRLLLMLFLSMVIAALSAVLGVFSALTLPPIIGYADTRMSGMMAVMAGLLLTIAIFFSPRHGIFSKIIYRFILNVRIYAEDILGLLYRLEELKLYNRMSEAPEIVKRARGNNRLFNWIALYRLRLQKAVTEDEDGSYILTEVGRQQAGKIIRSHRLWESYLHEYMDVPLDHLHFAAETLEHITDDDLRERLSSRLMNEETDPQGREIPPK